jgi:hypothetical protein
LAHFLGLAGDLLLLILDELGDIGVLLECIPDPVMVEIEALVTKLGQGGRSSDIVEIRADY